jgi:glycosyltransferase involved in cell wall biosynthesis
MLPQGLRLPPTKKRAPHVYGVYRMHARLIDGIICIGGEDWWYHNRGHYDFQIMQRLAKRMPVLFVNSLGVRMPSVGEGANFFARIGRKMTSLARGLTNVQDQFWVMSPLSAPGPAGQALTSWALSPQIRLAAHRIGMRQPLLWVHCPPGADLIDRLPHEALVFQRTDRFEAFPDGNRRELQRQVSAARARADLVVYCARTLMQGDAGLARRQVFIDHGVDYDTFLQAGLSADAGAAAPADIAGLPGPRAVFVGGIDHHTFDPELFVKVARALPDVTFPMIGGCSLPEGWCPLPNVHLLGRKPYAEVARYMAAADVLLMPWNSGEWIQNCNPVKTKEYLATGRPVVSTPYPELAPYLQHVAVANTAETFAAAIRQAIANPNAAPCSIAERRNLVAGHTWEAKADGLLRELANLGIVVAPAGVPAPRISSRPVEA